MNVWNTLLVKLFNMLQILYGLNVREQPACVYADELNANQVNLTS